jgi:TrmH family RNA methyltransferase
MIITSTSNERIKQARKLHARKTRLDTGLFLIEGLRVTGEAVERGAEITELIFCESLLVSDYGKQLVDRAGQLNLPILQVSMDVFRSLALKEGPQGIAAVVRQKWESLESLQITDGSLWVALDAPQDPGNVGTILRTLDSVGGEGIFLLDNATDPFDPTSIRASMGSIFNLRLVKASFTDFTVWKNKRQVNLVGSSGQAEQDYHSTAYPGTVILLMGSERLGLQERHLNECSQVVRIPMVGKSDSLNLAVSTAVILYEIFKQKRTIITGNS